MDSNLIKLARQLEQGNFLKEADQVRHLIEHGHIKVAMITDDPISEGLRYHIDRNIPLTQPVYRLFSKAYFDLLTEARTLHKSGKLILDDHSEWILDSDNGKFAEYKGYVVPLDHPMMLEEEESILKMAAEYKGKNVQLGKPRYIRKGEPGYGRKKSVVYVKDGDRVKRIMFGDPNLSVKPGNPKARKSFMARHKCHTKKDRTSAGYWACHFPPNW